MMGKRVISILLVGILLIGLVACGTQNAVTSDIALISNGTAPGDPTTVSYTEIARSNKIALSFCQNTTMFRVTDLTTGAVYDSGLADSDRTKANVSLTYIDDTGVSHTMDSFADAVKARQFETKTIENGIQIKYSLGKVDGIVYAPKMLTQERYLKFYDACTATGKKLMTQIYKLIDLDNMDASAAATAEKKYPQAKSGPIYVQKVDNLQAAIEKKLHNALKEAGYTDEDYEQDAAFANEQSAANNIAFNVTMEVTVDDDALRVRIPEAEIRNTGAAVIQTLNVLPHFSRFTAGTEGYYLLPDGSGSVMNFFNGKNGLQAYSVNIYGDEETVKEKETVYNTQQAILPIFGCHAGESGWLAIIEDGDALAGVTAAPGDSKTPSYVYPSFRILQSAKVNAISAASGESSTSYYITTQGNKREGDLTVSYHFLSGERSTYSGMAQYYKEILFSGRQLCKEAKSVPLFVDLIGNVTVTEKKAGVSFRENYVTTTPEQALSICTRLQENADEVCAILSGYADGGYAQSFLRSSRVSAQLEKTIKGLRNNGIRYSVAYEPLYASKGGFFDRVSSRYVSRMLTRDVALLYESDPAYFNFNKSSIAKYVLNLRGMNVAFGKICSIIENNELPSVTLFSVGKTLNADYYEKAEVERQTMLEETVSFVEETLNTGATLITSVGNAPIATRSETVIALPLTSSNFDITDYSVPFAAMVYSGYLTYSGDAVNLYYADDSDYLHLIENGAAPYCIVTAQNSEKLRNTEQSGLFSVDFDYLEPTLKERYRTVKEALDGNFGVPIIKHECLQNNVFRTEFSSGAYVIVNYNNQPIALSNGVNIPAKSFVKGAA